jgi:hypothetical protein
VRGSRLPAGLNIAENINNIMNFFDTPHPPTRGEEKDL